MTGVSLLPRADIVEREGVGVRRVWYITRNVLSAETAVKSEHSKAAADTAPEAEPEAEAENVVALAVGAAGGATVLVSAADLC